jgi:hypothetical protein
VESPIRREGWLKRDQLQTRNAVKVAGVARVNGVAEFLRARTDHEIAQRKIDADGGLLATDAGDDFRRSFGQWINGDGRFQIVEERPAATADFGCVGAVDAVADLGNRDGGQHDRYFGDGFLDSLYGLGGGQLASLSSDEHARIEHYSQDLRVPWLALRLDSDVVSIAALTKLPRFVSARRTVIKRIRRQPKKRLRPIWLK